MKRKLLAILLAMCMVLSLMPVALAEDTITAANDFQRPITVTFTYTSLTINGQSLPISGGTNGVDIPNSGQNLYYSSMKDLLTDLADGQLTCSPNPTSVYTLDTTAPLTIHINHHYGKSYSESISEKVVFSGSAIDNAENELHIAYPGPITIQAWHPSGSRSYSHQITFAGGLEVQNGADLTLDQNNQSIVGWSPINYVFSGDVTVEGSLTFSGDSSAGGDKNPVTFSNGAALTVESGGTATIGSVSVSNGSSDSSDPLITVKSGGTLSVGPDKNPNNNNKPTISYGTINTSGTAIAVESGGELTVSAGVITSTDGAAIEVENGGRVSIQETTVSSTTLPTTITTSDSSEEAVALSGGSTVKKGELEITVGTAGTGYVNNDGEIILPAGSTVTEGDKTTELPNGGTVTKDETTGADKITPNAVPVESVTLSQSTLTLTAGDTAALTAEVLPTDATDKTVTWSSSDETVATVKDGVVTAISAGQAVITASAGDKKAECIVTVQAPYVPVPPVAPVQPVNPTPTPDPDPDPDPEPTPGVWSNPYADVSAGDWYYDAVAYVSAEGIMTGTTASTFAPNDTMTRAMVWMVLARMEGQSVEGGSPWYALAQSWAMNVAVSDGTGPNDSISREQLVTMLYRQAGSPEVGVSELAKLGQFTDGEAVSDWAQSAMAWAVANGILTGEAGALNPQAGATRAQVAAILRRFCQQ